jgi:L-fucose mutarotase/ribose pyranase (RbsD/FucU family)
MLNLNNMEAITHPELEQLLVDFRRVQVSRFPIDTMVNKTGEMVAFVDSRYPTDAFARNKNLALLYFDGYDKTQTKKIFTVESRLIQNDRYSPRGSEYFTKSSSDVRKVAKMLRDYVKPYTGLEVAQNTLRTAELNFQTWRDKPMLASRDTMSELYREDLLDIFTALKALGVPAVNDKMQKVYNEALPAYLEGVERKDNKFAGVHISFNPDDSVVVTCMRDDVDKGINKGAITYESLETCPAFVQQQVSMLRIMENDSYLPNVGTRISDKTFWIDTIGG